MDSHTALAPGESVQLLRVFHVELFRGGMNRLLLRAMPTTDNSERIEICFFGVELVSIPMDFEGLTIEDSTEVDASLSPWAEVLVRFPDRRIFRLISGGKLAGRVAAVECAYDFDEAPLGAKSMFFMMD